jgi:hypothetical protein
MGEFLKRQQRSGLKELLIRRSRVRILPGAPEKNRILQEKT